MPAIDPERYNDAVLKSSILEAVMDALDGMSVSDFMESFPEVSRARSFRNAVESVCAEHSNTSPGYVEIPVEALGLCHAVLQPEPDSFAEPDSEF